MDLKNLSFDEKSNLAEDINTPLEILRDLAKDDEWNIRRWVAINPNVSEDLLRKLATDKSGVVKCHVAMNPKSSSTVLLTLFSHEKSFRDPNRFVLWKLYENKNLPLVAKIIIETLYGDMI